METAGQGGGLAVYRGASGEQLFGSGADERTGAVRRCVHRRM